MEDFKRPDHNDFRDSSELAKESFCGIRHNSLSDYMELWVEGSKILEMSVTEIRSNPEKWKKELADALGLHHIEFEPAKGN